MKRLEEIQTGQAGVMTATDCSRQVRDLAAEFADIVEELLNWRKQYAVVAGEHAPLPWWVKR
jgi:hypothetical protein